MESTQCCSFYFKQLESDKGLRSNGHNGNDQCFVLPRIWSPIFHRIKHVAITSSASARKAPAGERKDSIAAVTLVTFGYSFGSASALLFHIAHSPKNVGHGLLFNPSCAISWSRLTQIDDRLRHDHRPFSFVDWLMVPRRRPLASPGGPGFAVQANQERDRYRLAEFMRFRP